MYGVCTTFSSWLLRLCACDHRRTDFDNLVIVQVSNFSSQKCNTRVHVSYIILCCAHTITILLIHNLLSKFVKSNVLFAIETGPTSYMQMYLKCISEDYVLIFMCTRYSSLASEANTTYISTLQQSSIHSPVPRSSIHPNFIMHIITGTEDEV